MARILVVDDEEVLRLLYREELQEAGHTVDELDGGDELLATIEAKRPDLVILDICMPQYDGLELLGAIRRKHRDLPVILCSAFSSFKGTLRTLPADAYVLKSSNLEELKRKIESVLKEREPPETPASSP